MVSSGGTPLLQGQMNRAGCARIFGLCAMEFGDICALLSLRVKNV